MAIMPPATVCAHGIAADRALPCRTCAPEAFAPPADRAPGPDLDSRLRALEEEFAYLKRPVHAAGFEIEVPAAGGPGPKEWGTVALPYVPIEAEMFHGLSLVPDESLWIAALQAGRCTFFDGVRHTSVDLRRLGVVVEGKSWNAFRIWPAVGLVVTLQNRAPIAKKIRGAFLVETAPFPTPIDTPYPGVGTTQVRS